MNALLPILFVAAYIYGIVKSQRKTRAALYPLLTMGAAFLIGFILSRVEPNQAPAIGTITGLVAITMGIGVAIAMSRDIIA